MSGKVYTLREMKSIVEYLVTHKAYGEVRGRKLWTDFASSKLTNRTWQSLKETFLKRILPDIHNPYYGLTRSQIVSFKHGYDVDTRSNNKLEIQTISDESNHADTNQDNEKPSTSHYDADKKPGEIMSPSTLDARHRASTETIILENCYETPEDIQRDLESPTNDNGGKTEKETPSKSLRDLITYAEPLTPMMQQVLDDFATDDEGNLQIVENTENQNEGINMEENSETNNKGPEKNIDGDTSKDRNEKRLSDIVPTAESVNIPLGQETKTAENSSARNSSVIENDACNDDKKKDDNVNNDKRKKKESFSDLTVQTATTQNTNNSTDTTIPANQEALKKNDTIAVLETADTSVTDTTDKLALSRKRSNSHDANPNKEKKKALGLKNKKKSQSETEGKQQSKKNKLNNISEENNVNERLENQATDSHTKEIKNSEQNNGKELPINPCLSSVSLYDEQFNNVKYTDSDSSDNSIIEAILDIEENANKNSPKVLKAAANVNEVVILKSHSESDDSKAAESKQDKLKKAAVDRKERDRALASVFGFSTGAVSSTRKRKISRRHRSTSFNHNNESDSSEWTSESDSEYVSPPRGRRNRHARKYLKPKSARILSLEEEGGLFVMHGKRIYPLVKDGKIMKNYLTFSPESDPEDDPNYWKKKYEEERKKTEELKKMVEEAKEQKPIRNRSPALPLEATHSAALLSPPKLIPIPDEPNEILSKEVPKQEVKGSEKTLKIKFTKNNEELQLEGHWSQLHPVLADVVQIFNKDSDHAKEGPSKEAATKEVNGKADADEVLSLRSTPLDEESVRKKVEKLEEEIFKEIEELDKSEREAAASTEDQETNVNKRKRIGRSRKSTTVTKSADSSSSPSRAKRTKAVKKTEENGQENVEAVVEAARPKRRTKSPKKISSDISTVTNGTDKNIPKRTPRKSAKAEPETTRPSIDVGDEADVRYMFPPESEQNARKSLNRNKTPTRR